MEIEIDVNGFIMGARPREAGERAGLVKVVFLLKDTLTVFGEEGEVIMNQCCYEQKTISLYSTEVDDLDYVKKVAGRTLCDHMHMDPEDAEVTSPEVAITIRDLVQETKGTNPFDWTVLLEVHVECSVEKADQKPGEPSGEHGYDRLVQRLGDDVCAICHHEFSLLGDIVNTTCHHTFHRSCLFQWLCRGSYSCPLCRSDVAPIRLDLTDGGPPCLSCNLAWS
ncbi:hypothetical protein EJ110_NYTH52987 [Nymphaea thermarum]|nr:hypothetical protein EJ110_NYTH52987 [Nymphaea thermarum]